MKSKLYWIYERQSIPFSSLRTAISGMLVCRLMEQRKEKLRIDKWLWAARFYKTRSAATDAVNKGQILVNEQKPKPSRAIMVGDILTIVRSPQEFTIEVIALNDRRRPAAEAKLLYEESRESIARRDALALQLREEWSVVRGLRGDGRPSKRQRRQIIRFQNSQTGSEKFAQKDEPGSVPESPSANQGEGQAADHANNTEETEGNNATSRSCNNGTN